MKYSSRESFWRIGIPVLEYSLTHTSNFFSKFAFLTSGLSTPRIKCWGHLISVNWSRVSTMLKFELTCRRSHFWRRGNDVVFAGDSSVEKGVLMSVVLPNPDSPWEMIQQHNFQINGERTNNHDSEVSTTFGDNLMPLSQFNASVCSAGTVEILSQT